MLNPRWRRKRFSNIKIQKNKIVQKKMLSAFFYKIKLLWNSLKKNQNDGQIKM
jgi:hypothetical protein